MESTGGLPVPSKTGKATPIRNTRLYSVVELDTDEYGEREKLVSIEAIFSSLMT